MKNFNSHPHEEDDHHRQHSSKDGSISTHILTKRMTHITHTAVIRSGISTHILTKRMTFFHRDGGAYYIISTHILTKRMTESVFNISVSPCISTHILTKRMTLTGQELEDLSAFQLTSSRRG